MTIPANTRPLTGNAPRLDTPAGATDCHIHLYPQGFAAQPGGPEIAETASVADYAHIQRWLGLERTIITQSNAYQFDNRAVLQCLQQMGSDKARAIVALPPDVAPAQLQRLDALGVRGVRVMNLPGGAVKMPQLAALERTVRDMDWSLIVQFNGRDIDSHEATLQAL